MLVPLCRKFLFDRYHTWNSGSDIYSAKHYWRITRREGKQWSEEPRKRDKQQKIFSGIKVISLVKNYVINLFTENAYVKNSLNHRILYLRLYYVPLSSQDKKENKNYFARPVYTVRSAFMYTHAYIYDYKTNLSFLSMFTNYCQWFTTHFSEYVSLLLFMGIYTPIFYKFCHECGVRLLTNFKWMSK